MNVIKSQIEAMTNSDSPYFPPPEQIYQTQTDINVWPYNRQFRGKADSLHPIVWEREAGYQQILPQRSVSSIVGIPMLEKETCFQLPCSTILPCKVDKSNFKSSQSSCVYSSP